MEVSQENQAISYLSSVKRDYTPGTKENNADYQNDQCFGILCYLWDPDHCKCKEILFLSNILAVK